MSVEIDDVVALTEDLALSACGVDWDVSADICLGRTVTVTEIRVRKGGQQVNGALCEDAQEDIEASLIGYLEEAHHPRDVFLAVGVDGGEL